MKLAVMLTLAGALGVLACGSDDSDDGTGGGASGQGGRATGGAGGTTSGGKSGGGQSGATSGGSAQGGSSGSSSGGTTTGGSGGSGGQRECETVNCLRPYECVEVCGGPVLSSSCCDCEPPQFDQFGCQGAGGAS